MRLLTVVEPRALTADPAVRAEAYTAPLPFFQPLFDARMDPGAMPFPGAAAFTSALVDSFDNDIEVTTIRASFDVRHRFTKRLTFFTTLFWLEEDSTGDLSLGRKADRFTVRAGLIFNFEPIRFEAF